MNAQVTTTALFIESRLESRYALQVKAQRTEGASQGATVAYW
jgi:hypothetical protein